MVSARSAAPLRFSSDFLANSQLPHLFPVPTFPLVLPVALLRKMSPSAETKKLREEMASNPLAVLPSSGGGELRAESAELVGNYALRIRFSDGHDTGIYTWDYLLHLVEPTAQESS